MHIPYGLCYALIANVPPVYGIYTSFFPVLVYFLFGTSRHLSFGTSSIVSLMVSELIESLDHKYIPMFDQQSSTNESQNLSSYLNFNNTFLEHKTDREHTRLMIMIACTFWVGIFQMAMFMFHLGVLASLFSETLIKGFILGCSFHVSVLQLKHLLGLEIDHHYGLFEIPHVMHL